MERPTMEQRFRASNIPATAEELESLLNDQARDGFLLITEVGASLVFEKPPEQEPAPEPRLSEFVALYRQYMKSLGIEVPDGIGSVLELVPQPR